MSQIVQKCIFPVHSYRTLKAWTVCSTNFSTLFHFTCLKLIANSCIKQKMLQVNHLELLWAMIYNFCLGQPKSIEKHFPGSHFKEKKNPRTFQGLPLKFKDFSRLWKPCNLRLNTTNFILTNSWPCNTIDLPTNLLTCRLPMSCLPWAMLSTEYFIQILFKRIIMSHLAAVWTLSKHHVETLPTRRQSSQPLQEKIMNNSAQLKFHKTLKQFD